MLYKKSVDSILIALNLVIKALLLFAINMGIEFFWAGMELHRYGITKPSYEDAVIGIILTFSIFNNIVNSYLYWRLRHEVDIRIALMCHNMLGKIQRWRDQ